MRLPEIKRLAAVAAAAVLVGITTWPTQVGAQVPDADLEIIDIADTPDPTIPGQSVTYEIPYQNNGPDDATGVLIVLTLDGAMTYSSAVGGSCAVTGPTEVTCNLSDLANGSSSVLSVTVAVQSGLDPSDSIRIDAVIGAAGFIDSDPTNNADFEVTQLDDIPDADLYILDITDSPDPVIAGNVVTYTIDYGNNGPNDSTAFTVAVDIESTLSFVSMTDSNGGTCSQFDAELVYCNVPGLARNGVGIVTLQLAVAPDDFSGNSVTTQARIAVAAPTVDPNPANNSDTEDTDIDTNADVSIVKSGPSQVDDGGNVTYTLTYANNVITTPSITGSVAEDVVVTDTLPNGVLLVSATPQQGTCGDAAGVVTCQLGDLGPGATGTIQIVVSVPAGTAPATLTNEATIETSTRCIDCTEDGNPSNDTSSFQTVVNSTTTTTTAAPTTTNAGGLPEPQLPSTGGGSTMSILALLVFTAGCALLLGAWRRGSTHS